MEIQIPLYPADEDLNLGPIYNKFDNPTSPSGGSQQADNNFNNNIDFRETKQSIQEIEYQERLKARRIEIEQQLQRDFESPKDPKTLISAQEMLMEHLQGEGFFRTGRIFYRVDDPTSVGSRGYLNHTTDTPFDLSFQPYARNLANALEDFVMQSKQTSYRWTPCTREPSLIISALFTQDRNGKFFEQYLKYHYPRGMAYNTSYFRKQLRDLN